MKIVGAQWTAAINQLKIDCDCGEYFYHRADRWRVVCPICQKEAHLQELRDEYVEEHTKKDHDRDR